jgi:hypothetical protein
VPLLNRKSALEHHYSKAANDCENNLKTIDDGCINEAPIDSDDDLLADLDMPPEVEPESAEELIAALNLADEGTAAIVPASVAAIAPPAEWLADVRELARKHGPFAPWQIVQIIRALNAPADEASR